MDQFIIEFIRENSMVVLGILALLVSTLGVRKTLIVKRVNVENRFYDKLEADSVYQLSQNVKDIERILNMPLELEGSSKKIT